MLLLYQRTPCILQQDTQLVNGFAIHFRRVKFTKRRTKSLLEHPRRNRQNQFAVNQMTMDKRLSALVDFTNHDNVLAIPRMEPVSDFTNRHAMGIGLLGSITPREITKA